MIWKYVDTVDSGKYKALELDEILSYARTIQRKGLIFKKEYYPTMYIVCSVKGSHEIKYDGVRSCLSNTDNILSRTVVDLTKVNEITIHAIDNGIRYVVYITDEVDYYNPSLSLFYDGYNGYTSGILTEDFLEMPGNLNYSLEVGRMLYGLETQLAFYCDSHNIDHRIRLDRGLISGVLYLNLNGKRRDLNNFLKRMDNYLMRVNSI